MGIYGFSYTFYKKAGECGWFLTEAVTRRCFVKKAILRNSAKSTGKHLCHSLFFNKVAGLSPGAYWKWKRIFKKLVKKEEQGNAKGVFSILPNIYDGASIRKLSMTKSRQKFLAKIFRHRCFTESQMRHGTLTTKWVFKRINVATHCLTFFCWNPDIS